jgi:hypothetical protein
MAGEEVVYVDWRGNAADEKRHGGTRATLFLYGMEATLLVAIAFVLTIHVCIYTPLFSPRQIHDVYMPLFIKKIGELSDWIGSVFFFEISKRVFCLLCS